MCNDKCDKCKDKCRIAVTVEDDFAPCHRPENCFDIEIRSRDGCETACGKVTGGSSAVFELPCKDRKDHDDDCGCNDCGKDYSVTVTGGVYSSPRAQTRRVHCCCEETSGVTFIFMTFEPECCDEPCCCPPPCHWECECKPPKPHKPKKEHECEEEHKKPDCCECECKPPKPPKPHKPKKEQESEKTDENQVTAEE